MAVVKFNWNLLVPLVAIIFSIFVAAAQAIQCYECKGPDNECTVGLLGDKTECPPDTKFCYKSWTVEHWPMTKRKCADSRDYEPRCHDVLWGQLLMLACYCDDEDFCNGSPEVAGSRSSTIMAIVVSSALVLYQRRFGFSA